MALLLALGLLMPDLTKEEVIKMVQDGVSEEAILARIDQDGAALKLSADDLVDLKNAGVSDKIVKRLMGIRPVEGKGLALENRAHKAFTVSVDAANKTIHFFESGGTEIARKQSIELDAPDGTYKVMIAGRKTSYKITTPVKMTMRGCNITEVEVMTAYLGEGRDGKTLLLQADSKQAPESTVVESPTYPSYAVRTHMHGLNPFLFIPRCHCPCCPH